MAVSSIGAERGGTSAAYGVAKAGVSRLVKSIAATYGQHNIRANAILPGLIDTPMAIDGAVAGTTISQSRQREARVPMAYIGHRRPTRPSASDVVRQRCVPAGGRGGAGGALTGDRPCPSRLNQVAGPPSSRPLGRRNRWPAVYVQEASGVMAAV